jgi:hypothetical protein
VTPLSLLLALLGQLTSGVATATVGWAVVLLFGRVPQSRRPLLAGIGLGSLVWLLVLVAVILPAVGDVFVAAVPRPGFLGREWLTALLIALAAVLPLAIGLATVAAVPAADRPQGLHRVAQVLRGYPYAVIVAVTILFLAALRLVRKVRSLQRGWLSENLPFIVKEGRYEAVVRDLESALHEAGLAVERRRAPRVLEVPPRMVALVAGAADRAMIPDELFELDLDDLGILVYPSDIALLGPAELVARARAVIARRITFTDAYLTLSEESEEVEDRLAGIARVGVADPGELAAIDEVLASLVVPYEDWQTLYRLRLQVEHDHRGASLARNDAAAAASARARGARSTDRSPVARPSPAAAIE